MVTEKDLVPFDAPRWEREGHDWPNRASSRFLTAGGLRFHVQIMGAGPELLLVHGTGAATHSFRDLSPRLAERFTVIAPDLPGHGFTEVPPVVELGLSGMARSLFHLLEALGARPRVVVGHSAGAAILCRMTLDRRVHPNLIVGLNAALLPLSGVAGRVFSPVARLFTLNPILPRLIAWRARDPRRVERTIEGTGSKLDARGIDLYQRLVRCPAHVAGAIGMMAEWDLEGFARELESLTTPLVLICGERDRAVPLENAKRLVQTVRTASIRMMADAGHLSHEEKPDETAGIIFEESRRAGVLSLEDSAR